MSETGHKISASVEIWQSQDDIGKVAAPEVIVRNGVKNILVFKS